MTQNKVPLRGVPVCPQATVDAAIRNLTYNAIGAFSRFVERVESCRPEEAGLAAELAFTTSNFLNWQRLSVGDTDSSIAFYGKTPANLYTLASELRRVGNLARGKANGHAVNALLPIASPSDSFSPDEAVDFWRGLAEHFMKGGSK
jgi:hypothetical protein